jgi:transposase-like protein
MKKSRKRYSSEFKAKVALEALKEQKTLSELAQQFQLHPNQISQWKKQLLDNVEQLFLNNSTKSQRKHDQLEAQLYQQIGQLTVELDWLKKKV